MLSVKNLMLKFKFKYPPRWFLVNGYDNVVKCRVGAYFLQCLDE
jgi:hypothetical protein